MQTEIDSLKQDVSILIEKNDHILGSLTYLADEYDDFNVMLTARAVASRTSLRGETNLRGGEKNDLFFNDIAILRCFLKN